ncbi:hypothetical protein NHH03_04610 [Stieleria sp. TO1_6]|nr:hypothetical protein [Stieleria tagensis]
MPARSIQQTQPKIAERCLSVTHHQVTALLDACSPTAMSVRQFVSE